MINIGSNSGKIAYGIKEFYLDTTADLEKLPNTCEPGSMAYVIADSSTYCLNSEKKWIKVSFTGTGGTSSSSEEQDITILS